MTSVSSENLSNGPYTQDQSSCEVDVPTSLIQTPYRFYFLRHKRQVIFGLTSLFLTNFLDALPPLFIGKTLDLISGHHPFSEVRSMIGIIFVVTIGLSATRFSWRLLWGYFSHTAAKDLQDRIFAKLTAMSPKFLSKNPVGELVSLIANDVNYFRMAMGPGVILIMDALSILIIIPPLMISISLSWTLKTLILMPLLPFVMTKLNGLVNRFFEAQQTRFSELTGFAQELVAGIRVIKSYSQEKNKVKAFNRYSRIFEEACNRTALVDAAFVPIMELAVSVGSFVLLLVGAPEVMSGVVSIGSFFAFYQYIDRMVWPVSAIGFGLSHIQQGNASFTRIKKLFEAPMDIVDDGKSPTVDFADLTVKNLTFTYPDRAAPALKNVSFSLRAGETLGIVGTTGSGKSTLLEILCRLHTAEHGSILLNNIPYQSLKLGDLRKLITLVPQEAFLFSEKIIDNITLGLNLSPSEVERLTDRVELRSEIEDIPGGLNAYLGERGVNLSGGQKQRLTIARALARNTPLLILDDALSAVDSTTAKKVLEHLRLNHSKSLTVIIASHRIESVRQADRILVLNRGEVDAYGTHAECLKQSPTYLRLLNLQKEGVFEPSIH